MQVSFLIGVLGRGSMQLGSSEETSAKLRWALRRRDFLLKPRVPSGFVKRSSCGTSILCYFGLEKTVTLRISKAGKLLTRPIPRNTFSAYMNEEVSGLAK